MDNRNEIRQFLASRRARITPQQAGLIAYGGNRRVPGLRREEVAMLVGISLDYYSRLERGRIRGISEEVLEGIVRALQLDEAERAHLIDLVRSGYTTRPAPHRPARQRIRTSVQLILDSMTGAAFVRNERLDILSANQLGYALYSEAFVDPARPANLARFIFLDRRSPEFYVNWDGIAHDAVASLRGKARRDPYDRELTDLVGELSTHSEDFRTRWSAHIGKYYRSGVQTFHHPLVGNLTLNYDALELAADTGQTMIVYTAEPNSPSHEALNLLASWTSRPSQVTAVRSDQED